MLKDGTMEVEMSQAVAGIKGTRFELNETGTESTIRVTEGTVAFVSKATGDTVMVTAGEAVTATGAGFGEKTTFDASVADAELIRETDVANVPVLVVSKAQDSSNTLHFTISIGLLFGVATILYIVYKRKRQQQPVPVTVEENIPQ